MHNVQVDMKRQKEMVNTDEDKDHQKEKDDDDDDNNNIDNNSSSNYDVKRSGCVKKNWGGEEEDGDMGPTHMQLKTPHYHPPTFVTAIIYPITKQWFKMKTDMQATAK